VGPGQETLGGATSSWMGGVHRAGPTPAAGTSGSVRAMSEALLASVRASGAGGVSPRPQARQVRVSGL
jgi:hypothetical protein